MMLLLATNSTVPPACAGFCSVHTLMPVSIFVTPAARAHKPPNTILRLNDCVILFCLHFPAESLAGDSAGKKTAYPF
jgi:hypothetical protein